jgi:hypothetical protein
MSQPPQRNVRQPRTAPTMVTSIMDPPMGYEPPVPRPARLDENDGMGQDTQAPRMPLLHYPEFVDVLGDIPEPSLNDPLGIPEHQYVREVSNIKRNEAAAAYDVLHNLSYPEFRDYYNNLDYDERLNLQETLMIAPDIKPLFDDLYEQKRNAYLNSIKSRAQSSAVMDEGLLQELRDLHTKIDYPALEGMEYLPPAPGDDVY